MCRAVLLAALAALAVLAVVSANRDADIFAESDHEVVYRFPRGARSGGSRSRGEECRYKKEPWEECDRATNTQKRKLILKRGSGKCEPTKELTRNCKKACRYEKGAWNACNVTANTRTRVDKLKPRSDPTCEPNRTVTKKCKSGLGCRYNRSVKWSECDPTTQTRTKTMPLVSGNSASCESHKVVTKPCRTNGDQRQAKRKPKQVVVRERGGGF
ncbi:hypothetical protein HPB52_013893 [Rhipicephalus sanguineus]|uniref:Pleiotrophin/Midkine C-terminal domain-containing protein n=1 Tax=Rhipicephalus sanguineus TaxID=34632 RepID=A0A9D4PFK4_RHISA|nr:hypothetical protein HPB52_013893 [Rhipicephalus sanguineus]